jgi:acetoin utilization deacetylase AcuC-like enzyme
MRVLSVCFSLPFLTTRRVCASYHRGCWHVACWFGFGWTACGYKDAYDQALQFGLEPEVWEPDLVIVSAGFDALDSDPLATVSLQADDFRKMTDMLCRRVSELSSSSSQKKKIGIVLGLEGGYQLDEMAGGGNLQGAVVATLQALLDARQAEDSARLPNRQQASVE